MVARTDVRVRSNAASKRSDTSEDLDEEVSRAVSADALHRRLRVVCAYAGSYPAI